MKSKYVSLMIAYLLFSICTVLLQSSAHSAETIFFVVRHCEKMDESKDPPLSPAGAERAEQLRTTLEHLRLDAIYSTDYLRTKQTAIPLANHLQIDIVTYEKPTQAWIDDLIRKHEGQRVLIVAHSNTLPQIASLLSGQSVAPLGNRYDALVLISVDGESKSLVRLNYGKPPATEP